MNGDGVGSGVGVGVGSGVGGGVGVAVEDGAVGGGCGGSVSIATTGSVVFCGSFALFPPQAVSKRITTNNAILNFFMIKFPQEFNLPQARMIRPYGFLDYLKLILVWQTCLFQLQAIRDHTPLSVKRCERLKKRFHG